MSSALDMSLDDLIKQSKSKPKPDSTGSGPTRRLPARSAPTSRAAPYPPPKAPVASVSPYGVYSDHVAAVTAAPPLLPTPGTVPAAAAALETGTKLYISNLDDGVTTDDIQELFSEVGELKRYSVNYDRSGRSKGTAEIVYARKADALAAIKRYSNVQLDGKPLKIELIGSNAEAPIVTPFTYDKTFGNHNAIPNSGPGRGGPAGLLRGRGGSGGGSGGSSGGRGRGRARGRDRSREQKSAADLDAELDQYHAEATKEK